jgi:hypothetical protein
MKNGKETGEIPGVPVKRGTSDNFLSCKEEEGRVVVLENENHGHAGGSK